jgi:hypothetical protein
MFIFCPTQSPISPIFHSPEAQIKWQVINIGLCESDPLYSGVNVNRVRTKMAVS